MKVFRNIKFEIMGFILGFAIGFILGAGTYNYSDMMEALIEGFIGGFVAIIIIIPLHILVMLWLSKRFYLFTGILIGLSLGLVGFYSIGFLTMHGGQGQILPPLITGIILLFLPILFGYILERIQKIQH